MVSTMPVYGLRGSRGLSLSGGGAKGKSQVSCDFRERCLRGGRRRFLRFSFALSRLCKLLVRFAGLAVSGKSPSDRLLRLFSISEMSSRSGVVVVSARRRNVFAHVERLGFMPGRVILTARRAKVMRNINARATSSHVAWYMGRVLGHSAVGRLNLKFLFIMKGEGRLLLRACIIKGMRKAGVRLVGYVFDTMCLAHNGSRSRRARRK